MFGDDSHVQKLVRLVLEREPNPGPTWEELVASYPHNPWLPAARSQAEDMRPGQGDEPYIAIYAPRRRQEWMRQIGTLVVSSYVNGEGNECAKLAIRMQEDIE